MMPIRRGFKCLSTYFSLFVIFFVCFSVVDAIAATFYVDYENGLDSNDGRSTETPFKHCPGDSNATHIASAVTLEPGDTVLFRGGVKYRGTIRLGRSGEEGLPITYKGDGWGQEKAIITGSEMFSPVCWTRCQSQNDCWQNENWSNIYYTALPDGMTFFDRLYQDDRFLYFSQDPNVSDPLFYDTLTEWRTIPIGDPAKSISSTHITDPDVFFQTDPQYWDGAYVAIWMIGNVTELLPITGYNPATNTISFLATKSPYTDRDNCYTVINHPALIDRPGEYAVSNKDNRLYLWAANGVNPNIAEIEKSERKLAFSGGVSHIIIEGLIITGTAGDTEEWDGGGGIYLDSSNNVIVRNCEFKYLSSFTKMAALRSTEGNITLFNNNVHDLMKNRGFAILNGSNSLIENNNIQRIGYTAILLMGQSNSRVSGNMITEVNGVHGNGISVYSGCDSIVVERNQVYNSSSLLTFSHSSNITVKNNIFDGNHIGAISEWDNMAGYIRFINNVMLNGRDDSILRFSTTDDVPSRLVINNVIDGMSLVGGIRKNNVYTGLGWDQTERHGWTLESTEKVESDLHQLFLDPDNGDYRPSCHGNLVDKGCDVSGYGVVDDFLQNPRPKNEGWDIGAYEQEKMTTPAGLEIEGTNG